MPTPSSPSYANILAGKVPNTNTSTEIDPYALISTIQLDVYHPLYLHPNDNPGLKLVNQILTGDNISQWKQAMTIALSAKNKLRVVNGTCAAPSPDSAYLELWKSCNNMVIS